MSKRIFGRDQIEDSAVEQFESAMSQDYSVQGALMPDAHFGYSLPIGGVVATKDVIVPAWVGYDIGCGMCALKTPFNVDHLDSETRRIDIFKSIYRSVPSGVGRQHKEPQLGIPRGDLTMVSQKLFETKGLYQIGTLGSGNHFIEVDYDEEGAVWIVIHSGSRGFGWNIAKHYMTVASGTGKASEGHFPLSVDSPDGQGYINDMNYALEYALENRKRMIAAVLKDIGHAVHGFKVDADWDGLINRNHNHAVEHNLDGEKVWIHRKGATHAEAGMMGVIPGNMMVGSFIVEGRGNPESLFSSSHGAGRNGSRKQARERISIDEFQQQMLGITAFVDNKTLDEAPGAYKNIYTVLAEQSELIQVLHHLKPIINIKAA